MNTRDVKEEILMRLYKRAGICGHCRKRDCADPVAPYLPLRLNRQDVIDAIDLDGLLSAGNMEQSK